MAEITHSLAEEAADLAINHQLRGVDACILAVAVRYECPVLYTWDRDLLKLGDRVAGVKVQQPVRVLPPQPELKFDEEQEGPKAGAQIVASPRSPSDPE